MVLSTRVLFCFVGLAVLVKSIPLERRTREVDLLPGIGAVGAETPLQDLIEDVVSQITDNALRQFGGGIDPGISSTFLTGTNTALTGINPILPVLANPINRPGIRPGNRPGIRPGNRPGGGVGTALLGSAIGSALATTLPLLLRPRLGLIRRRVQKPNGQHNFDAQFMNLPGSKDAYLYLTHSPQSADDYTDVDESRGADIDFPSIHYRGTKIGTVNIKAPPSNLEIDDSLSGMLKENYNDYETYEEFNYKR